MNTMVNLMGFGRNQAEDDDSLAGAQTFVSTASEIRKEDVKFFVKNQLDCVIKCLSRIDIDREETKQYFTEGIDNIGSHDVAVLSDVEETEDTAIDHRKSPDLIAPLKTPEWGNATRNSWVGQFLVEEWIIVARQLTRMSEDEKMKIRGMEIPQLLDFVRAEWPEREKIVFPDGFDGMMVEDMRERTINQLRLTTEELLDLTFKGKRRVKKHVVDYVQAVRPTLFKNSGQ